jgi:hypothetical protein
MGNELYKGKLMKYYYKLLLKIIYMELEIYKYNLE